jgi:hypothetical protein
MTESNSPTPRCPKCGHLGTRTENKGINLLDSPTPENRG